jgi:Xaa-Pro aminopeptidase
MQAVSRVGALAAAVLLAAPLSAGEPPMASPAGDRLQDDLAARRKRVAEKLGADVMLVLQSPPSRVYSRDVDYSFRQDSNLYYLTGIDQEDTALVLLPGAGAASEVLFVRRRDAAREHRDGRRLSRDEAKARSGIATVYDSGDLEPFLRAVFDRRPFPPRAYTPPVADAYARALAEGRARVALDLDRTPAFDEPLPPAHDLARKLRERAPQLLVSNASGLLAGLRQVKTPYERTVLARSVEISSRGMREAMRAARPGASEYTVRGALEREWSTGGALGWGYPPIVASGPNATILHHPSYERRLEAGDLLLIDAAASYEYLTGDITRTFPVSGKFTPDQRTIYDLVLAAQEAGIQKAGAGVLPKDVHEATVGVIKEGLLRLGLITDASGDQYRRWYTHGSVHYIGMDVHDVGDSSRPLEVGSAFVIEPGLYIREDTLDALPDTPESRAFIEKVRPAVRRFKDIGVRIEDSFLITEQGLQNLSGSVPRKPQDVEAHLQAR